MGLMNEIGSMMSSDSKESSQEKLTPRELRKAFPALYKEFIYSEEQDVVQFLKDTNNLDRVLEFLKQEEMKDMEEGDDD